MAAVALGANLPSCAPPSSVRGGCWRRPSALMAGSPVPVVIGSRAAVAEARRLLGPDALLGRSVHSPAAADAEREGADYILFGRSRRPQAIPAGRPAGWTSWQRWRGLSRSL